MSQNLDIPEGRRRVRDISNPELFSPSGTSQFSLSSGDNFEELFSGSATLNKLGLTTRSSRTEQKLALRWALLAGYLPEDPKSIEKKFVEHVEYSLAQTRTTINNTSSFQALALSVRDRLIERWKDTQLYFMEKQCKRVAYLSMEYLLGRSLQNAIFNLNLQENYASAMNNLGILLEELYDEEKDAGLGNGGLGRLAACFMDSLASLDYPAWGYGLRYNYGMFYQGIKDGHQIEFPDYWLTHGNPWEIERLDVAYPIKFYGTVVEKEVKGKKKFLWEGGEELIAVAYDNPIPGYRTYNTINIRLWSSKPSKEFDLTEFNKGDYLKAIEDRQKAEGITHVLYPTDNTPQGTELRLKQQYLFVSATLQDLIYYFKSVHQPLNWSNFPSKVAIQLNDTHPTLAIPELMRILVDQEDLEWGFAWDICVKTFGYTNHTVLPEALEKWDVGLMEHLLPRHMQIIYQINYFFIENIKVKYPDDFDRIVRMSLIEEGYSRKVRMAYLASLGSHAINGVAALHSEILKQTILKDYYEMFPDRFQNKTNGVTPRRWIHQCNPDLALLVSAWLKTEDWLLRLDLLVNLQPFADHEELQRHWMIVKRQNKQRLADYTKKHVGVTVSIDALFDVQVKRFHEYKRQLLNILGVIHRYHVIKTGTPSEKALLQPRVVFFGGKAAPGYYMAKLIIKLINNVAKTVNNDKDVGDLLKVVFLPNYRVSLAEIIIPASDISQHISTAGTEASGTSNMKFTMNGGLILGTLDGANVEIKQEIGDENIFIFGALTEEVPSLRKLTRTQKLEIDPRFTNVIDMIQSGTFGEPEFFTDLINSISNGNDHYLVAADFPSYLEAQQKIDAAYKDTKGWARKSILCTALSHKFSSDRTIHEYAKDIWDIKPTRRPGPLPVSIDRLSHSTVFSAASGTSPLVTPSLGFNTIALERMSPIGDNGSRARTFMF